MFWTAPKTNPLLLPITHDTSPTSNILNEMNDISYTELLVHDLSGSPCFEMYMYYLALPYMGTATGGEDLH